MRNVPNDIVKSLCRYLPMLIDEIDRNELNRNLRLGNAVRITKNKILPKLKRIDNEK